MALIFTVLLSLLSQHLRKRLCFRATYPVTVPRRFFTWNHKHFILRKVKHFTRNSVMLPCLFVIYLVKGFSCICQSGLHQVLGSVWETLAYFKVAGRCKWQIENSKGKLSLGFPKIAWNCIINLPFWYFSNNLTTLIYYSC